MTRTTYKEQMAEAKRIEDLEMMLKGAIQRGGELIAERDRYKEALERVCYCTDETGTCKCILLGREALDAYRPS